MTTMQTFIDIRRRLHQIPEPGFQEFKTQALLLDYLNTLPPERFELKMWRTGILVKVKGTDPKRRLAWRADMDGLPIAEDTTYEFRSTHPGYMHACGHDMHMSIGLGILTHFVHNPVADDLIFIFQPAEEGPGGAQPMMESAEFQEWKPDLIFALHIAPEYPVGTVATRPGILFANIIAERARLEGTIRTMSMESMHKIKSRIEALVSGIEAGFECRAEIDYGANYCQVFNTEELTTEFMDWVRDSGVATLVEAPAAMTGEDFGYFLEAIPGFLFWLGVDTPYGLHHSKIEPSEDAIGVAVNVMTKYLTHLSEIE